MSGGKLSEKIKGTGDLDFEGFSICMDFETLITTPPIPSLSPLIPVIWVRLHDDMDSL